MPLSSPASSAYSFQGETLVFPNTSTLQSLQRAVQASQLSLHPRLHSIADDAAFLASLLPHYPPYPRLANLHCGAWYLPPSLCLQQPSTCYFKSSDSHCYHWTFSVTRCNPHVIDLCGREGGVLIVDATRMGKRFPDSFSRTIPIWCCVVNRAIARWRRRQRGTVSPTGKESARRGADAERGGDGEETGAEEEQDEWDQELHTPEWVSDSEKAQILQRIDDWALTFTVGLLGSHTPLAPLSHLTNRAHRCCLSPLSERGLRPRSLLLPPHSPVATALDRPVDAHPGLSL